MQTESVGTKKNVPKPPQTPRRERTPRAGGLNEAVSGVADSEQRARDEAHPQARRRAGAGGPAVIRQAEGTIREQRSRAPVADERRARKLREAYLQLRPALHGRRHDGDERLGRGVAAAQALRREGRAHHPDLSDAARDAAHDEARLNALRDRGRKACLVVFPDKAEQERLKKDFRKMSTADMDISRNRLSRWVGDMERNSHN